MNRDNLNFFSFLHIIHPYWFDFVLACGCCLQSDRHHCKLNGIGGKRKKRMNVCTVYM